jgi:hypothetical protein
MNGQQLFLKPEEAKFLSMAVISMFEQLKEVAGNPQMNWEPSARKDLKDMMAAGNSLRLKLGKLGFDVRDLPPFEEGDWNTFFTKPS